MLVGYISNDMNNLSEDLLQTAGMLVSEGFSFDIRTTDV